MSSVGVIQTNRISSVLQVEMASGGVQFCRVGLDWSLLVGATSREEDWLTICFLLRIHGYYYFSGVLIKCDWSFDFQIIKGAVSRLGGVFTPKNLTLPSNCFINSCPSLNWKWSVFLLSSINILYHCSGETEQMS